MSETSTTITLEIPGEGPPRDIFEATLAAYTQIHSTDGPGASRLRIDTPDSMHANYTTISSHLGIEVPMPLVDYANSHPGPAIGVDISPYVSYPDFQAAGLVFDLNPDTARGLWLGIQLADNEGVLPWRRSSILRHETVESPYLTPTDMTADILGLRPTILADVAATLLLQPETFGQDKADGEQIASQATLLLAIGREALRPPSQDEPDHEDTPTSQVLLAWKKQLYEIDSINRLKIRERQLDRLKEHGVQDRLSRSVSAVLRARREHYNLKGVSWFAERAILRSGLPQLRSIRIEMIQAIADATDEALLPPPKKA